MCWLQASVQNMLWGRSIAPWVEETSAEHGEDSLDFSAKYCLMGAPQNHFQMMVLECFRYYTIQFWGTPFPETSSVPLLTLSYRHEHFMTLCKIAVRNISSTCHAPYPPYAVYCHFQGWVTENPKTTIASAAAVTSGLLYYWSLGLIRGELSRGLGNAKKAFFMGIS